MEWYMADSIYFLSVPQLLNDPRTQQKPSSVSIFSVVTNYNNEQHDPYRHSLAVAVDYYQPQQEPLPTYVINKQLQFLISISSVCLLPGQRGAQIVPETGCTIADVSVILEFFQASFLRY